MIFPGVVRLQLHEENQDTYRETLTILIHKESETSEETRGKRHEERHEETHTHTHTQRRQADPVLR